MSDVSGTFDTLVDRVLFLEKERPKQLAVAFKKEQVSYGELGKRMRLAAARLERLGICRGERVLFSALSKPEMVAVYLGIQYLGAVAVFVDKNAAPSQAAAIAKEAGASVFLTDKPMKELACRRFSLKEICALPESDREENTACPKAVYRKPEPEELAELLFTSGTTGRPKGVMLSYRAVYHILKNTAVAMGIREDERILLPLPLNHSFALRVLRAALFQGAGVILQNGFTFAREIENNLDLYGCTALAVVPASVETIARQMQDRFPEIMGRFRYIEASAGSLSVEQRKRLTSQLPNTVIYNTWGSSESGGALFLNVTETVTDPVRRGALGKPLPGIEVRVLDENGNEMESDREHPGRMALRGPMQMSGYWGQEELTEQTLKDGWLLTGDLVYTDADGYVYMLGRIDDQINVGGEKVSPIEVENAACEYPHIRECACVGAPDPEEILGFVPVLYVAVRDAAYSPEDLHSFLAGRLERYKLPVRYIALQSLPRNQMQKLDRKALAAMWETRGNEDLMNPVMQAILTRRSIRRFEERPIPRPVLEMILQAGYHAPSGHNMQTWRFTVVEDREKIRRLKEAVLLTARECGVYCYGFENPACIILISNDERNPDGCQDASCAAENIFLAAHSYGIGAVWLNALMTLRGREPVKHILDGFGIPDDHRIWCMAALGYPLGEGVLLAKNDKVVHFVDG